MARKRPDVGRKAGDGSYCSGKNKELQSGTAVAACAAGGTAKKCALLQAAKRDEKVVANENTKKIQVQERIYIQNITND